MNAFKNYTKQETQLVETFLNKYKVDRIDLTDRVMKYAAYGYLRPVGAANGDPYSDPYVDNINYSHDEILSVQIPSAHLLRMAHEYDAAVRHLDTIYDYQYQKRQVYRVREDYEKWAEENDKRIIRSKQKLDVVEAEYRKAKQKHDVLLALTYNGRNST